MMVVYIVQAQKHRLVLIMGHIFDFKMKKELKEITKRLNKYEPVEEEEIY
mgnify:CR=1 FL=1